MPNVLSTLEEDLINRLTNTKTDKPVEIINLRAHEVEVKFEVKKEVA